MCKLEKWSVRTFRERIDSMLYERTAISKKPDEAIQNELRTLKGTQQITRDLVFRDPYFLNFLGLHNSYSEKDLESASLAELEQFLIEMSKGFSHNVYFILSFSTSQPIGVATIKMVFRETARQTSRQPPFRRLRQQSI